MIRIALVDDEKYFLSLLYEKISYIIQDDFSEYSIEKFTSGNEFLLQHKNEHFDVVFLDIVMPNTDGFQVASEICNISEQTYIIFVTTESMLVYDSFNFNPFDFIPKNISIDIMDKKLRKTLDRLSLMFAKEKYLEIRLPHNKTIPVRMFDIVFLTSFGNNIQYHIKGRDTVEIRKKLIDAEAELDSMIFLRLHKSFIVNMGFIENVSYHALNVVLKDGTIIPVSKPYKKDVEKHYNEYLKKFGRQYK